MGVEPGALILLALLLLVLPLKWLLAALLAAAVHELWHLAAVRLLGGRPQGLWIGARGACMGAVLPGRGKELLAIAAGPLGSLSLVLFARALPRTALCGLIQGLYNLIPVEPLDGGRAARLLLERWCPTHAASVLGWLRLGAAVCAVFMGAAWGLLPALALLLAVLSGGRGMRDKEKIPVNGKKPDRSG